ncbi:MAG: hypothetical protein WAU88_00205 [Candidatus Zixiibacteriota bacterium]
MASEKLLQSEYRKALFYIRPTINDLNKFNELLHLFTISPDLPKELFSLLNDIRSDLLFEVGTDKIDVVDSVILFNRLYSYERADLYSKEFYREDDIILLPYLDIRNPLLWPNLLHEYGHIVLKKQIGIGKYTLPKEQVDLANNWLHELFADRIAVRMMGASYIYSVVSYFSSLELDDYRSTLEHPSFPYRLRQLLLKLPGDLFSEEASQFANMIIEHSEGLDIPREEQRFLPTMSSKDRYKLRFQKLAPEITGTEPNPEYVPKITPEELEQSVETASKDINWCNTKSSIAIIEAEKSSLVSDLHNRMPIPSILETSNVSKIRKQLDELKAHPGSISKEQLLADYNEKRLDAITIINLAWTAFRGPVTDQLLTIYRNQGPSGEEKLADMTDYYLSFNNCILKSIESSQLIKAWQY